MLFHFYWVFAWLRFIHGRSRGPPFLIHQGLSFLTKSDQILSFTTKWDQGEAQSSSLSPVLSAIVGWTPPLGWNKIFETYSILQILVFFAKRIYFQKDHLWSLGWAKEVHKSSSPCGAPWVPARMIIRDVRSSSRTILSTMKPIYERNTCNSTFASRGEKFKKLVLRSAGEFPINNPSTLFQHHPD